MRGRGPRTRTLRRLEAVALILLGLGCQVEAPPPSDPELREELGIPDEVRIHRVDLSGRGELTRVIPERTTVAPGAIVQFVVLDNRVHLLRFLENQMEPALWEFLQKTRQDQFPPLVERGTRLVLSFESAPPGVYFFQVEGYGEPVMGEIRVAVP